MADTLSSEAYVLHARSYRETSLLVEVISAQYGREGLIARGARSRRGGAAVHLQPFRHLHLGWRSRGDLGMLNSVEELDYHHLPAAAIGVGLYLNELLMRLWPRHQEMQEVYVAYSASLRSLAAALPVEPILRSFELRLLRGLGYAPLLDHEAVTGAALSPEQPYRFYPEQGPVPTGVNSRDAISGATLLAIACEDWSEPGTLAVAKRILRAALEVQLGARTLRTRVLLGGLARYRRMSENEQRADYHDD